MRELGVQASSDTVGTRERGFLNNEFQQLSEEIDRIANSIEFNGNPLLNGNGSAFEVQIGTKNNPLVDRIKLFDPYSSNVNLVSLGINLSSVADKTSAQNSLASIDQALNTVTSIRAGFGSMQNRLQSVINNLTVNKENMMAANSRIRDADLAEETSEMTKAQILNQAGVSVLAQANSSIKSALGLLGGQT
jgi:flagellin